MRHQQDKPGNDDRLLHDLDDRERRNKNGGGGLVGAAIGTAVGGPLGGIVGGTIGTVGGGLAGMGVAERVDPTVEDSYWRANYRTRSYVGADETYETYRPAYRYGWESGMKNPGHRWAEVEHDLGRRWGEVRGTSSLQWDRAKLAARDAWHRVGNALLRDFDRDAKL